MGIIQINELRIKHTPVGDFLSIDVGIDDSEWAENCYLDKIEIIDLVKEYDVQDTIHFPHRRHHFHHHHHHGRNPRVRMLTYEELEQEGMPLFPPPPPSDPHLPHPSPSTPIPEETIDRGPKPRIDDNIIIDIDPDSKHYTGCQELPANSLYQVNIYMRGYPDPETPCQGDTNPKTVIVYDRLYLYKVGMYNIKDVLYNCCADNSWAIHFILMWKYFELSIQAGQYVDAVKLWIRLTDKKAGLITNKGCNCGNT